MKAFLRLIMVVMLMALGGLVLIRILYRCSWRESFEIADQLIADLIG